MAQHCAVMSLVANSTSGAANVPVVNRVEGDCAVMVSLVWPGTNIAAILVPGLTSLSGLLTFIKSRKGRGVYLVWDIPLWIDIGLNISRLESHYHLESTETSSVRSLRPAGVGNKASCLFFGRVGRTFEVLVKHLHGCIGPMVTQLSAVEPQLSHFQLGLIISPISTVSVSDTFTGSNKIK